MSRRDPLLDLIFSLLAAAGILFIALAIWG